VCGVELAAYTDADLELSIALETDPVVMKELGGAITRERVERVHERRVGDPWYLTIVPEPGGPAVGTIGIWPKELDGETIFETGWMVLPAHQGRGLASAALSELIARATADGGFDAMHAFPPVTNAPSNALCRKFAFELRGEREFVYAGRPLRCNHWARVLSHRA
jgi:RimJ/RimL family protein N-acetyltransferase